VINKSVHSFEEIRYDLINSHNIQLVDGGKSFTEINSGCQSSEFKFKKIAIIIPYRDRLDNLKIFLNNMHLYWTKQKINYGVYLIEPAESLKFNRGLLMNIGFREALKDVQKLAGGRSEFFDCFIFHDVDMIPEDLRVPYTCNAERPG
jgi:hypothetical protein